MAEEKKKVGVTSIRFPYILSEANKLYKTCEEWIEFLMKCGWGSIFIGKIEIRSQL